MTMSRALIRLRLFDAYVRGFRHAVGGGALVPKSKRNENTHSSFELGFQTGADALLDARQLARENADEACP